MEYRSNSHRTLGLNDLKYQDTPQSSAILLAKLQQKVARLEVTLRDKEADFRKVQSSLKTTHINELKLQTQVYYQEILRLKNELNLLQESKEQERHSYSNEPIDKIPKKTISPHKPESQPSPEKKNLIKSIEKLREENERLSGQLSSVQTEKEKLESEFERILRQAKEEELRKRRSPCTEDATQTSPKHTSSSPSVSETTESVLDYLKVQIEELQRKEKAWEEEKSMYKDLVHNLKEDRVFFKDTSQKRHDELWALQKELVKLQKDIGGFQLNGKPPLCKQCTKPSYRSTKSSKKTGPTKESSVSNSSPPSTSQRNSNSSSTAGKPPKPKSPSPVVPKRLPSSQKPSKRDDIRSTVSKPPSVSSTSSSRSSSAQSSPSQIAVRRTPNQSSPKSPSSHSASTGHSSGTSSGGRGAENGASDRPVPAKRTIVHVDSPSKGKLKTEKEEAQPLPSPDSAMPPRIHAKSNSSLEDDEEIAREILRGIDSPKRLPDSNLENGNHDTGLPSSQSSQVPEEVDEEEEEKEPWWGDVVAEDNCFGDSQEDVPDAEKFQSEENVEAFVSLLEAHMNRRRKLNEVRSKQERSSSPKTKSSSPQKTITKTPKSNKPPSPSSSKASPKKNPPKPNARPTFKSPSKPTAKTYRPSSTSKKSPTKLKRKTEAEETTFESYTGDEPQNLKDIDHMICLLESHFARKQILSGMAKKK